MTAARSPRAPNVVLAVVSTFAAIAAVEGTCRLAGYDLSGQRRALEAIPIFYRQPTVPVGSVFFRRPGPASWTGNVLSTALPPEFRGPGGADPYATAGEVTITYDRDGMRNPDDLDAWEIAVAGDSFTELGYLPHEDLFTTELGRRLGVRVKNLGVSRTGPASYLFYLETYGASPALRHAVLVFFEGNDLRDLRRERGELDRFAATGVRPLRTLPVETSPLRWLRTAWRTGRRRDARRTASWVPTAFFRARSGEVPVSLLYVPLHSSSINPVARRLLEEALAAWAGAAQGLGATPWLVFMPCKRRVLDGGLRFTAAAPPGTAAWRPTALPATVGALATARGIRFIDVTPALAAETAAGRLTYNPVWDTHLNARGSRVVGRVIAEAIGATERR